MSSNNVVATVMVAALAGAVAGGGASYALLRHAGFSPTLAAGETKAPDQARIEQVLRDYLPKHPDILVEMTNELDKKQAAEQEAQQQKAIGEHADLIFRSPATFVGGNPNGDVSVVEFFDYNCGYCRRAMPDVVKLVDKDPKIRLVLKDLPIFGEESEDAAKGALAAMKQGKYFEMHQKLFSESGKANKEKVLKIAKELNLDVDKLQKDMDDPSVKQALEENKALAEKLGLQGTPLYLIGDKVLPGAPDDLYDQLEKHAAEIRAKGCTTTC